MYVPSSRQRRKIHSALNFTGRVCTNPVHVIALCHRLVSQPSVRKITVQEGPFFVCRLVTTSTSICLPASYVFMVDVVVFRRKLLGSSSVLFRRSTLIETQTFFHNSVIIPGTTHRKRQDRVTERLERLVVTVRGITDCELALLGIL